MTATDTNRIGIVGAGALGGLFGGYLHESGRDVVLVDKDPRLVERIGEDGLTIERTDEETLTVHPTITTTPTEVQPVDVLFVFVKAIHTQQAIQDAEPMIHDETVVGTVQNGLRNLDILREHVPADRVVGGTTTEGASLQERGHVLHTGRGVTKVGGEGDTAAPVVELLADAGFETAVVDSPESHIWRKQLISVAIKPTAALTELLDGPLAEHEETRWVMEQLVTEAVTVAEAKGVEVPSDDPLQSVLDVCEVNYETKSSMLEDVQKHRETEIDHINGAIVEYADQEGIDAPFNRMATALVKGKEHSYTEQ